LPFRTCSRVNAPPQLPHTILTITGSSGCHDARPWMPCLRHAAFTKLPGDHREAPACYFMARCRAKEPPRTHLPLRVPMDRQLRTE
jgi:hypothetical protein